VPTFLTLAEAQAVTEGYHELWVQIHRRIQDEWWGPRNMESPIFQAAGPTARATIIHDMVAAEIRRAPQLVSTDKLDFFAQLIDSEAGAAVVRFKLLDSQLRTMNHVSGQQDLLDRYEFTPEATEQLLLAGMTASPAVLTCGYQLSPGEVGMEAVVVACHYERKLMYCYDLESGQRREALYLPGIEPPEPSIRSRREDSQTGSE